MAANNSVNDTIDERILRLLGLLDVFDLDYETYISLLREKLVEVTAARKKIPAEEFELLKNEFKRVRGKTGRFKPKKKKPINSKNVSNLNSFGKKLIGGTATQAVPRQGKTAAVSESLLDIVKTIRKTVDSIHKSILTQSLISQKEFNRDRKGKENLRRRGREEKLEEKKDGILETAKKILTPFQSIFDRILRFLVFTILGRAFKVFMDWASDPNNKKKLETIGRFLKDWWPTLLGAWFLFATPLGRFTRTIIGTIAKLSFKLAKFAIPKLLSFAKSHPLIAAGAGIGLAAGAGFMMEQNRNENSEKRGQGNWWNEIGKSFNPGQLGMGGVSPMGHARGGSIFSGLVDSNSGTTVSGAGPDTQFFPIEGGGGAVLQKGETVLQVGARERMIKEAGIDPLAYNVGPNANKPRSISANILGSARGGLIGLSNGGSIGMAAHHLKQDEALSSLTKGINDFTRPGSSKWSKISSNTPIHSYIDSVGQPTIGWGSTYYDSILNGKNPVKPGDTITKGKADSILFKNIENLAKEYSSKIPYWTKMTDKQRAGLLVLGYNAPYGPLGAFKKLTKSLQDGDIRGAAQNLQRGGPNPDRIALERNLLMSGPLNLRNLVGPKIVGEKKVGSGIPFIPPFMYKKQGGGAFGPDGKVLTNTGTKNPHSAADSRFVPLALHPDEYVKVFTKDFADRGGMKMVEYLQAMLDSDSNARKQGTLSRYNIEPPIRAGKPNMMTLPPITQSSMGTGSMPSGGGRQVPGFSVVPGAGISVRQNNADLYGIVG